MIRCEAGEIIGICGTSCKRAAIQHWFCLSKQSVKSIVIQHLLPGESHHNPASGTNQSFPGTSMVGGPRGIKPPSNALLEKEWLNLRLIPFFDGLTQFFLCPSEVGTVVRTNHPDLPSTGNEASECVYKRICSQGFSHLKVDGSTCQTGKEGSITFYLAPAPLNQDGSKIVDASIGERWLLRVNAIWWKIGHHLL